MFELGLNIKDKGTVSESCGKCQYYVIKGLRVKGKKFGVSQS